MEDKDLLLIDLLARLPYGVKIKLGDYDYQVCGYNSEKEMPVKIWYYYDSNLILKSYIDVYLTDYRPYLRPMSNMTEEEWEELNCIGHIVPLYDGCFGVDMRAYLKNNQPHYRRFSDFSTIEDWLNAHHFDYRGLIKKGLALEAPDGMYNIILT